MLMVVKNQIKVSILSIKYALMREMLNKVTFITNILFMILNNACFIIQWIVLYSIKDNIGGYSFKEVLLLWGFAASTFGISRFFFNGAFNLSDTICNGKLDAYIIMPKNILISVITSKISVSAIGDILYGYIMLIIYGLTLKNLILFTILSISGGIILTCISIIFSSLSFYFTKTDIVTDTMNNLMVHFATYPEGIFKGITKLILYTIIPIGIVNYIPVKIIHALNIYYLLLVLIITIIFILISYIIFYKGLKKYTSSNLMIARL